MPTPRTIFESARLGFRELCDSDLGDLAALYADQEVMHYFESTRTRLQAAQQIRASQEYYERLGYHLWAVTRRADGRFIGRCGLLPQVIEGKDEVEIAYMLSRKVWGQGLGTEAVCAIRDHGFRSFDFSRLVAIIDPENAASIRVATKSGMHFVKKIDFEDYPCVLYAVDGLGSRR